MAELVGDHVVDGVDRRLHEGRRIEEPMQIGAAPAKVTEAAESDTLRCVWRDRRIEDQ